MKKCDWYKNHMRCIHCKVLYPRPDHVDVKCPTRNSEHPKCPQCGRPLRLRPPHQTRRYSHMGIKKMRTECIYMTDWKFAEKLRMELLLS